MALPGRLRVRPSRKREGKGNENSEVVFELFLSITAERDEYFLMYATLASRRSVMSTF